MREGHEREENKLMCCSDIYNMLCVHVYTLQPTL